MGICSGHTTNGCAGKKESSDYDLGVNELKTRQVTSRSRERIDGLKIPLLGKGLKDRVLTDGSYEVSGKLEAETSGFTKRDFEVIEKIDGEEKLIFVESFRVSESEEVNGVEMADYKIRFTVEENALPVAVIVWSIIGVSGLTAGGYMIKQINQFTGSGFGQLVTISAVIIAVLTFVRSL